MYYAVIGICLAAVAVAVVFIRRRNKAIQANGIVIDTEISRIENVEQPDGKGGTTCKQEYFVRFTTQDGRPVEARLGNPPRHAAVGSPVRVKYLPDKPTYVRAVK